MQEKLTERGFSAMMQKNGGENMGCDGKCAGCGGCAGALTLSREEIAFLEKLGEIPFLPVARTAADPTPVYLEEGAGQADAYRVALALLEKKGLIESDFDAPLKGFVPPAGTAYPIWGSIGLTARGQQVLDLLSIQGAEE